MNLNPYISICIPAYKNIGYLKRLLDSIASQTFRNYEVVIADDSPDEEVCDFVASYSSFPHLVYLKNNPALGTPANWNEAIKNAQGNWIKLMHDDDWFSNPDALKKYYEATIKNHQVSFFFSAFRNITEETGEEEVIKCNFTDLLFLRLSPLHLFKRVYVGNPSCTLVKRELNQLYDAHFKFVVDFEYYIRCFRKIDEYKYIDDVLINVGFNKEQVTKYTFLNPAVQIPENYLLLKKLGNGILKNIFVYDYYWRLHRNLKITSEDEVLKYYDEEINSKIKQIISFQKRIPLKLLQVGIISKSLMIMSFLRSHF